VTSLAPDTLLNLLQMYDRALRELELRPEPRIKAFCGRLQRRRAEVVAALAEQGRSVSP